MTGLLARAAGWTRAWRVVFGVYVVLLLAGTHWPRLEVPGPGARPDLVVHLGAFGVWTGLLTLSAFFGPALASRNILRAGGVGLAYAVADESTQMLAIFGRVFGLDDMLANVLGSSLATLTLLALSRRARGPVR